MAAWVGSIRGKFKNQPPALRQALLTLAALAVWSFFLWRAIGAFGPASDINDVTFNSDSAIPVLMANDDRPITIFNLYYYGTDRWGAWPFLVTQVIRRATGYRWTDQSLFALQALWLFAGALVIAGLSCRDALPVALAYLIALCLHVEARSLIFELSQLYAWQTGALLLAWYALRRLLDSYANPAQKPSPVGRAAWVVLACAFSFLAVWSSNASILFLFFLLHLEAARAWSKGRAEPGADGKVLKPYLFGLIAVAAATLLELLQKWNYHRHTLKHYGKDFRTSFKLDTDYLAENLGAQLSHLGKLSWWPLYLLPTLAVVTLICLLAYAYLRKRAALLERLRVVLADDTLVVAAGAYGIAAINFILAVLIDHIRLNSYDNRFLTLTNLFGPVSGLLTVYLLIKFAARSPLLKAYARPGFALVCAALLVVKFPATTYNLPYQWTREAALGLARKAPRGVLLGGYWETYVFAALQPENTMTPVPMEGQELRMPWTLDDVRRAGQVVVAFRRDGPQQPIAPPAQLTQYGKTFRLADPKFHESEEFAFALYVVSQ